MYSEKPDHHAEHQVRAYTAKRDRDSEKYLMYNNRK